MEHPVYINVCEYENWKWIEFINSILLKEID